jgi:MYXO-CTERM domain-containing protein
VVVNAASISDTATITTDGGAGGDHTNGTGANEVEGPGGGGGGGYIALSGTGAPTLSAAGGLGGTTTVATSAMANFRTNGATAGNAGQTDGDATSFFYCGGVFTTFATHPAIHTNSTTGTFTFTNTSDPVTYECKLDTPSGTGSYAACSGLDAGIQGYATGTLADGTYTLSVRATDTHGNVESPPTIFTWTVDTVAPVTTIATHPTDPSNSSIGIFTFTNSEDPNLVTYECKLDTPSGAGTWAACNASAPTTAGYTTGTLADGSYTLSVRATDQAGNVETSPPSFPWTVQANGLDGGVDAQSVDLGVDNSSVDASPVFVDAEGDAESLDGLAPPAVDAAEADVAADTVVVKGNDTAPIIPVDAAVDAENADLLLQLLDVGQAVDTKVPTAVADAQSDTQPSGAEPEPDTAPLPEPNPDTAGPVVKADAAVPPANKDAASAAEDLKILGGGFCAIASPRSTSSAPYVLLGLAALAMLRRRRKPR